MLGADTLAVYDKVRAFNFNVNQIMKALANNQILNSKIFVLTYLYSVFRRKVQSSVYDNF